MLIRVAQPGRPAFSLRPGEEGISIFDTEAVDPPLTEAEILDAFRTGSVAVVRTAANIEGQGLSVIPLEGAPFLPDRLRRAHAEIRPGTGMARREFKQALKELE